MIYKNSADMAHPVRIHDIPVIDTQLDINELMNPEKMIDDS